MLATSIWFQSTYFKEKKVICKFKKLRLDLRWTVYLSDHRQKMSDRHQNRWYLKVYIRNLVFLVSVVSYHNCISSSDRYGKSGTPVQLTANYFRVNKEPDFVLTQYCVNFEPDLDVTSSRKKLVYENRNRFGNRYIFDGGSLYLTQNFPDHTIETTFNDRPMRITMRRTGIVNSSSPIAFQLYNLIFREAMAGLKLQNIRRDYYDPQAKVRFLMT